MKQNILLIALCLNIILWFTSNGWTEDYCCCTITCQYETLFGTSVTKEVDQCWRVSQISSCTPDEACLKVVQFGWTYTNEWSGKGCHTEEPCLYSYLLDSDSPQLDALREFRDEILSQTPEGREIINLYYQWSPVIVKAMEQDGEFKAQVKEMIDGVVGVIGGVTE